MTPDELRHEADNFARKAEVADQNADAQDVTAETRAFWQGYAYSLRAAEDHFRQRARRIEDKLNLRETSWPTARLPW